MQDEAEIPGGDRSTRLADGRTVSQAELAELLYGDLHRLASSYFRDEGHVTLLQPTALVHEAYMRLADQSSDNWESRTHFIATSARTMRNVLIDARRSRGRDKRGGHMQRVTLLDDVAGKEQSGVDILDLEAALTRLGDFSERYVRIVELRYFGGLTFEEIARLIGVSKRQIMKDWNMARSYLSLFLGGGELDV